MTTLLPSQAAQYAANAGFSGENLVTIVAIMMAESGLITDRVSPMNNNGTRDYGLYQINSEHFGKTINGVLVNAQSAMDPVAASKIAFGISGGSNFCAWCTYNEGCSSPCNSNGVYRTKLSSARMAVAGVVPKGTTSNPDNPPPPSTGSGGGLIDVTGLANTITSLPATFINDIFGTDAVQRYILVTIAGIIILLGIAVLFFSSDAGKGVEQEIEKEAATA